MSLRTSVLIVPNYLRGHGLHHYVGSILNTKPVPPEPHPPYWRMLNVNAERECYTEAESLRSYVPAPLATDQVACLYFISPPVAMEA